MRGHLKIVGDHGRPLYDALNTAQAWLTPNGLHDRARWKPSLVLIYVWLIVVSIVIAAVIDVRPQASPWPEEITARHFAAAKNCDTARAVGLAPARRGEPGYWPWLDADDDGVACEVWRGYR